MKIAIVGSSVLSDRQEALADHLVAMFAIAHKEDAVSSFLPDPVLVSGGAVGVDTIAENVTKLFWKTKPMIFLPENRRWEPNGYKERNLKIAEACDVLYCIRAIDSNTYGSGWTADQAARLGKTVWRYYV